MGHRSSKSSAASATGNTTKKSVKANRQSSASTQSAVHRQSNLIPIPPVINLQFQESANASSCPRDSSSIRSLTSTSNSYPRQIIIKIQLTKMENGQHESSHDQQAAQAPEVLTANFRDYYTTDANSNQLEPSNSPIFDLMLNHNYMCDEHAGATTSTTNTTTAAVNRAAGSATTAAEVAASSLRANYNRRTLRRNMNAMQLSERPAEEENPSEAAEYCEVLEEGAAASILSSAFRKTPQSGSTNSNTNTSRRSAGAERKDGDSARRSKNRSSFSSFKRMLEPSGSKSNKSKDRQEHNNNDQQHSRSSRTNPVLPLTTPERQRQQQQQQQPCCSAVARGITTVVSPSSPASISSSTPISITPSSEVGAASATTNRLSIRTQNNTDVIIPFSSPQFVVVCPTTSLVTVGRFDNNGISLMTTEIGGGGSGADSTNITTVHSSMVAKSVPNGPIVHSQVDFVHCLVPDLVRIFNSSFYWGKMDRYEAERLLEGKPEGTFLLRDSAQEEYLFSVTFRKYERSLHARIEQSGHKFSFDCHDPCVFTAPTVTGLLEHYKDPSCVMFFEPMLTIPFHRKAPFSLQQLARATIVSNTTYDGISELELPMRLKAYLKEYHYKQKLRVKPFDESFFACT